MLLLDISRLKSRIMQRQILKMVICFLWKKQSSKILKETIEKKLRPRKTHQVIKCSHAGSEINKCKEEILYYRVTRTTTKKTWIDKVLRFSNACSERNNSKKNLVRQPSNAKVLHQIKHTIYLSENWLPGRLWSSFTRFSHLGSRLDGVYLNPLVPSGSPMGGVSSFSIQPWLCPLVSLWLKEDPWSVEVPPDTSSGYTGVGFRRDLVLVKSLSEVNDFKSCKSDIKTESEVKKQKTHASVN